MMKTILKKFLVVFMVLTLMLSYVGNCANKPLYEKFGYDEDFKYDDEYIAHALKSSVVYIRLLYDATCTYRPITFNIDMVKGTISQIYEYYQGALSEDEVINLVLNDMQEDITGYLYYDDPKTIDVSLEAHGSGVVISEDGYIATNAHVVGYSDKDKAEACIEYLQSNVNNDIMTIINQVAQLGINVSQEKANEIYNMVLETSYENCEVSDVSEKLLVCFPSSDGDTDIEKNRCYEAEIVEKGTVEKTADEEGYTKDAAILKIDKENLVSLKFSPSYPETNSKIVTAGFPGAADRLFQQVGSDKSVLSVSIGTGNIARLIEIKGHDYKAMEITTTISHGNSGGPSVDSALNIEGLNTYGLTSDMRFAYMIPSEFVIDLADDVDLIYDEVSRTFFTGLQMLQKGYGLAAKECFEHVKSMQKDTPYIENLIKLSNEAPQQYPPSMDKGGIFNFDYKTIIIITLALIIVIMIVVMVIKSKKNKKTKVNVIEATISNEEFKGEIITSPIDTKINEEISQELNNIDEEVKNDENPIA